MRLQDQQSLRHFLTTVKLVHVHSSVRTFLSGFSAKCFERCWDTVWQRNSTWFTSYSTGVPFKALI